MKQSSIQAAWGVKVYAEIIKYYKTPDLGIIITLNGVTYRILYYQNGWILWIIKLRKLVFLTG